MQPQRHDVLLEARSNCADRLRCQTQSAYVSRMPFPRRSRYGQRLSTKQLFSLAKSCPHQPTSHIPGTGTWTSTCHAGSQTVRSSRLPASWTLGWYSYCRQAPICWAVCVAKASVGSRSDIWACCSPCALLSILTCVAAQSGATLDGLAATLAKPLRCLWLSQQSRIWLNQIADVSDLPFTPIVLVSASDPAAAGMHRSLREPSLSRLLRRWDLWCSDCQSQLYLTCAQPSARASRHQWRGNACSVSALGGQPWCRRVPDSICLCCQALRPCHSTVQADISPMRRPLPGDMQAVYVADVGHAVPWLP